MKIAFIGTNRRFEQSNCPECGHRLDGITPTSARTEHPDFTPSEGDFSICVYCAAILRFKSETKLRKADPDDIVQLLNEDPKIFTLLQDLVVAAQGRINDARRKSN